jgi:transposase InsO family protein
MILELIDEATHAGARLFAACQTIGLSSRTLERWRQQPEGGEDERQGPLSEPPNKLTQKQRTELLSLLNSPENCDLSPNQIVPRLADDGIYVASESTCYRLLRQEGELAHRQPSRPATRRAPQRHRATGPCQLWSWDITYLRSPLQGVFYYLYMIMDVWSRKIVGVEVHEQESSELAAQLVEQSKNQFAADASTLVLHSDNGSAMKGSILLATLQHLGVVPSFSRPRVSDDNPFSEALFRTLKYRPEYPSGPFALLEQARAWVAGFVEWYNTGHRHSALRFVTPDQRHYGQEEQILARRRRVYERAQKQMPRRWSGAIRNWTPVGDVCLNPDRQKAA